MIRLENILNISLQEVLKTSWRRLEDVFKTSWRRLEDVLKTFLQNVLKTSWKRLEDVLARRLENVLKTYDQDEYIGLDQDVLKTSWRRLLKTKTKDVLIKTNVWWVVTFFICLHDQLISITFYCPLLKNTDVWKMYFIK